MSRRSPDPMVETFVENKHAVILIMEGNLTHNIPLDMCQTTRACEFLFIFVRGPQSLAPRSLSLAVVPNFYLLPPILEIL